MGDARTLRAAKVDENQADIVAAMRANGVAVEITGMPLDLRIAKHMISIDVEVKNPRQIPSKRRLTDQEKDFYDRWHARGLICVIETGEDVRELVAAMNVGLRATHAFCIDNMEAHFAANYQRKRR